MSRAFPRINFKRIGRNFKFNSLEWRNIVTQGQLKENLYVHTKLDIYFSQIFCNKLRVIMSNNIVNRICSISAFTIPEHLTKLLCLRKIQLP